MENESSIKLQELILGRILNQYFNWDGLGPLYETRESIGRVENMRIFIYSNDHNPPHFHVQSNDRNVDAKFKIENGEYISGRIEQREIKKVLAFYNDMKVQMLMNKIWDKKNQ